MSRRRRQRPWNLIILMFLIGLLVGAYLGFLYGTIIGPVSGEVELSMVYGSEKRGWIQEISPLFVDWYEEKHPGESVIISFEAAGSSESMLQIVQGAINPVIWSPAASFWVPLANDLWIEYGISNETLIPDENELPMVYSPIVIASWEDYI